MNCVDKAKYRELQADDRLDGVVAFLNTDKVQICLRFTAV